MSEGLSLLCQLTPILYLAEFRLYSRTSIRHHARPDEVCRFMQAITAARDVIQHSIKPQQLFWDGCVGWASLLQPILHPPPVVNPPEPMMSRQHPGWAWKGEQTILPIASPVILTPLGQIWFPGINYSTGDDSRCAAVLLEERIKRHIGHSSCASQTLKFKIFINDLLKL